MSLSTNTGRLSRTTRVSLALWSALTGCSGMRSAQTESLTESLSPEMEALFLQASPLDGYSRAVGYGNATTGGAGAPQYVVDNLNDSGPGSLREGLQNPAPLMVTFKAGLSGAISLSSSIRVQSNKTVDGRGANITLSPANPNDPVTAFQIYDQSNIIIFHLNFDGNARNWDVDSEGADGITIKNSNRIWIHRSSFSRWVDGGVDARPGTDGGIPKDITISASHFEMIYQALNLTADGVTFAWNQCVKVRSRCIKIINGRAHSYNNFIDGWKGENIQHAKDGGHLLSEANIFGSGSTSSVKTEEDGKVKMIGNYFRSNSSMRENKNQSAGIGESHSITDPSLIKCNRDTACWRRLESALRTSSGYLASAAKAPSTQGKSTTTSAPTVLSPPTMASSAAVSSSSASASATAPSLRWIFEKRCEEKNSNGGCICSFSKELSVCSGAGSPEGKSCGAAGALCVFDNRCKKFKCQ